MHLSFSQNETQGQMRQTRNFVVDAGSKYAQLALIQSPQPRITQVECRGPQDAKNILRQDNKRVPKRASTKFCVTPPDFETLAL